jgi:hypothetical protein
MEDKKGYFEKNKKRIIFLIISVLILLILLGLWLQKNYFFNVADIEADVSPKTLYTGDTLFYKDKTKFTNIKEWKFGDGNVSVNDSGYYFYKKSGYYQVKLTLNGKYIKKFSIQVLDNNLLNINDSITIIEAPKEAMQFENVVFRANSKHAKLFSWKFGETGTIDSKEQMVIYSYKQPGEYMVNLYTDETEYPIIHKINILPSYKFVDESIVIEDVYKKIDDDFKFHLQQIADGQKFNEHYNYLLKKYLCDNGNVAVKINNSKINTFYYLCMGLQFDKGKIIQNVKVSFDQEMNCVTKVEITQN